MDKIIQEIIHNRFKNLLALAAVVAVLYSGTVQFPFHYDDLHSIVENPHIRQWSDWPQFFVDPGLFSADPAIAMYRPLVLASLAANYTWSGIEPFSYHIVNIGLHLIAAVLVLFILRRLGCSPGAALAAALLFAAHPLCSEPINYISSRSETQAACGVLAAFAAYLQWRRQDDARYLYWALGAFVCGLLSKSSAIVLPALLALYELSFQVRPHWRRLLPFLAIALFYLGLLVWVGFLGGGDTAAPRSLAAQWATQTKALVYYAKLILMPVGLSIDHPFVEGHWSQAAVWSALLLLFSAGWLGWRTRGQQPLVFLGLAWGLVCLGPTLAVPLNVMVNEHRLYLPLVGFLMALSPWWDRVPRLGLVWAVGLGLSAGLTLERNVVWADGFGLWQDAARQGPHLVRPLVYMANHAERAGRQAEAETYFLQVLDRQPGHVAAANNLANIYRTQGRFVAAEQLYMGLLQQEPELDEVHYNLGRLYHQTGKSGQARQHFDRVGHDSRHRSLALNNIGVLLQEAGRIDSALVFYLAAVQAVPAAKAAAENIERLRLGLEQWAPTLLEQGGADQVEAVCRLLLEQWPDEAPALFFLAVSLFKQERLDESIQINRRLTALRPDDYYAMMQLAYALEMAGRFEAAVEAYRAVLKRQQDPRARTRLEALLKRMQQEKVEP
jgi:protein O-mannosyl-transferase